MFDEKLLCERFSISGPCQPLMSLTRRLAKRYHDFKMVVADVPTEESRRAARQCIVLWTGHLGDERRIDIASRKVITEW